ncbi:hypothetical protein HMPREF0765_2471 [Sphingobacterium spiritivorum ATCC 33300]|uniref:Uncharacterized protein n=1 Tax=Sphingobacterium spiritivorum ATCC 33300 TaxID=525372 RepID=C2FYR5_SPHSI|nr:hypothetical protein HMPREF0765_2471 [Sphingobacterium spiritivorum ATCC 33300]
MIDKGSSSACKEEALLSGKIKFNIPDESFKCCTDGLFILLIVRNELIMNKKVFYLSRKIN